MKESGEKTLFGDVMVVGGGISGIQASLDLGSSNFRVFLVEKSPAIGGKMAHFDKTFPTNDCSMCIESPKFIECKRHPNIEIFTYTEVLKVEGEAGNFDVTLLRKPRYVREDKCTGCTVCTEYCPVQIPNPFNQNISLCKAIHIYFAQAIPLVSYIDENCLFLKEEKCGICASVCKNNAIDFNQTPEIIKVNVGAIIVCPGLEPFDPQIHPELGYRKMANVVTSLDYERLLCSTGPYEGEIRRASDGKHPKNIAWISCTGSRQVIKGGKSYCSSVCCTYTQKQVILTKEHDPDAKCTVFHNDIRAFGKDFERFYKRTQNLPGVRFIRSFVSIVRETPDTKNIVIRYSDPQGGVREEEFDMVVLSVGLCPPRDAESFAEKLGIELETHGFCKTNSVNPIETIRPGIFVSGAFQGPMDIPEAVMSASGAGSLCGILLNYRRGKLARKRVYPEERDVLKEEPRVGVYVCHCGANIGRVVDVPAVTEYAKSLENVVHAEESLFICSTDAAQRLVDSIREKRINRVVVAACTPRTHEPLFRDTLREAGINQYFFDMANIREHCSWVHSREKEAATEKAKDIVRMSVARARFLEPLQEFDLPVTKSALVVGGGVAGMTCALSIARQGYDVYIVEKEKELGGLARRVHSTLSGVNVGEFLKKLTGEINSHPLIHVYLNAKILESTGYVGNFLTKVMTPSGVKEIKHGVTVISVGAELLETDEYLYGKESGVVNQLELEEMIEKGDERFKNARNIVMIQCVGSREDKRNYCSRICCTESVKNALKIKERDCRKNVYILFRDMRTYSFNEDYYREAAGKGIRFIRYEPESKPSVEVALEEGRRILRVKVLDQIMHKILEIDADLISLAVAVVPNRESWELSKMFKVVLNPDGFFQEAHVKLRPVDFAAEGVFLCGMAHYPKHLTETINQAQGAAGRALTILSQDTITASGSVCEVNEEKCVACKACIEACAYGAIELRETKEGKRAWVNSVLCKGDGLCNSKCPTGAIVLKHYTDEQLLSQMSALVLYSQSEHRADRGL